MVENSGNDVGSVRELTSKEQIRSLYPESAAFFNGKQWEIWVEDGETFRRFGIPNTNNIRGNTEEDAWEHAWMKVQKRMIRKLES